MKSQFVCMKLVTLCLLSVLISSCSSYATYGNASSSSYQSSQGMQTTTTKAQKTYASYESRMPSHISPGTKTIIVDPNVHAWGAYDSSGNLVRAGLVTAGANYCPDLGRACRTRSGTFYIQSLGSPSCKSSIFPLPRGGAPMPYCMFFNGGQALHGSYQVVEANVSHGCVRLRVSDAEWLRYNFANVGTKVVVRPY